MKFCTPLVKAGGDCNLLMNVLELTIEKLEEDGETTMNSELIDFIRSFVRAEADPLRLMVVF